VSFFKCCVRVGEVGKSPIVVNRFYTFGFITVYRVFKFFPYEEKTCGEQCFCQILSVDEKLLINRDNWSSG